MISRREKTDVLIIGGGVTGFMAAYNIPEDRDVMLICSGRGASPFITGFNYVFAEGDSIQSFIEDSFSSGAGQNDPALVETLCRQSPVTVPFLTGELGMEFDMEDGQFNAKRPVGSRFPRVIGKNNVTGAIIGDLLIKELNKRDRFCLNTHARALKLMIKDGRAAGALCFDLERSEFVRIDAASVILCSGGFCRLFEFNSNSPDIGGDGIAMAYEAGLPLIDLEFIQFEPSGTVIPMKYRGHGMVTTTLYEGAVIYNRNRERFMFKYSGNGEKVNKDVLARCIYCEIAEGRGTDNGAVYFDCTGIPVERIHSAYESYYRRYLDAGIDITKEPIEVAPTAHTSLGGVKVKPDCSTAVKGLFACGEVAGGLHGANRLGGSAGTETLVFGKIAGQSASAYLDGENAVTATDADWASLMDAVCSGASDVQLSSDDIDAFRRKMSCILSNDFNVIRCGSDMSSGLAELRSIYEKVASSAQPADPKACYSRARLLNDVEAAYLFALAAVSRKDSLGAHWRTDAVPNDGAPYRIQICKAASAADGPQVTRIPIE